jgi:glycosyltransferase involved in cell wall biosynthesis
MMVGVPVVGSSSGAIPEVIGPGGLIFQEGDVRGLSSALEELLASDEERKDLGQRARAFALQHYTTEAVAAGYLSVFEMAYQHAWRI